MSIAKEESNKMFEGVNEKFESKYKKCDEDTRKQIIAFVEIAKVQSQIVLDRAEGFSERSLALGLDFFYRNFRDILQHLIRGAENVIKNPEEGSFYECFLNILASDIARIKIAQKDIEKWDSDWKKYFVNMDKIYAFFDALDNIENLQERKAKMDQELEERKKESDKKMYTNSIDMDLQNQYAKKFAEKIKEIIQKAKPGEIKMYNFDWFLDDQAHFLLMKDQRPILYVTKCFGVLPINPEYDMLDPVKDAHYSFTICSYPTVDFEGDYDTLEDLIKLMPEECERAPTIYKRYIPSEQERGLTKE